MTEHSHSYPGSSGQRDIVARLRWPDGLSGPEDHPISVALRIEAADEIERLRDAAQAPAYPECDTLRQALDAIEAQVHEMRSLKGWRLNLIRENLAKAKACIHGVAQAPAYPDTATACARIAELEKALKHAQEALFWHHGDDFEMDGQKAGDVIKAALGQVDHD